MTLRLTITKTRWLVVLVTFSVLLLTQTARAQSSGAISQGFETSSSNVTSGALVSLVASGKSDVAPANAANAAGLVGVAGSKPLVELSGGDSTVQVVTSGSTQALVSDMNGPVKAGDKITTSPVDGIGMKATTSAEVIGTAQANLSTVATLSRSVAGSNGKPVSFAVGLLPITVNVAYYSAASGGSNASLFVPSFLQDIANTLTGRAVSPLRVLIGALALLLGFMTAAIMLYVSVRSSFTSIGRNPLAHVALRRGLVDVLIASGGVLVVTVAIVYAVLLS